MARTVRVATGSIATLEAFAPPFNLRVPDPAENLQLGLSLLDAAGAHGADLACLPETFVAAGLPGDVIRAVAQPIPGPAFDAVAERARRYHMNIVAGFFVLQDEGLFNVAVLIDRQGQLAGVYAKQHPTEGEIECGVTPGGETAVVETDFGRVGLAICFDINWPSLWEEFARRKADLVCWLSAYEGGFPLQTYAWLHQYPVVSSVWPYHARVIDITGRIVASSSRWDRLALHTLNLDKRLFHTDGQMQHVLPIRQRYGDRIRLEALTEEHVFTLESLDPALSVDEVVAAFGLVDYQTYIERCTAAQQVARMPS
jgi:beta-ureidopropionase